MQNVGIPHSQRDLLQQQVMTDRVEIGAEIQIDDMGLALDNRIRSDGLIVTAC